jgi:uncharacterized protein (DUF2141 family)
VNKIVVNVSNIENTDRRVWTQHKSDKATCKFKDVKPGEYAVSVMHVGEQMMLDIKLWN